MPKASKKQQEPSGPFGDMFPYRETFETYRELPKKSRHPEEVMRELRSIARKEDVRWQTGQISGTYFHGGMEHFAYLNRVFALFSRANSAPSIRAVIAIISPSNLVPLGHMSRCSRLTCENSANTRLR